MKRGAISPKTYTIQVLKRTLVSPKPGTATAQHGYEVLFTTRAEVRSLAGAAEWHQVDINGQKATHTFTIRYTTIPFDIRHRVRDARGQFWRILAVEEVNLANKEIKIQCANVGADTEAANP